MKFTIGTKLLISFSALLALVISVGTYALSLSQEALEVATGNGSVFLVEDTIRHIDKDIFSKIEELERFSLDPRIQEVLAHSNAFFQKLENRQDYIDEKDRAWNAGIDTSQIIINELIDAELSDHLENIFSQLDMQRYGHLIYEELFVTNAYGVIVGHTVPARNYYQGNELWWQEAKEKGFSVTHFSYGERIDIWGVPIAVRIVDEEENFIGVIKGLVPVGIIAQEAELNNKKYDTTEIMLLTQGGEIIYESNVFGILENVSGKEFFKHIGPESGFFIAQHDRKEKLFSYTHSQGFRDYAGVGWILLMSHDIDEMFAPIYQLRSLLVTVAIILFTIFGVFAVIVSRSIARPIRKLTRVAEAVANGDLQRRVEIKSHDDIGQLARVFNEMTNNVEKLILNLKAEKAQDRAILKSLGDGLIVIDKNYMITTVNAAAEDMLGRSVGELLGKRWPDVLGKKGIRTQEGTPVPISELPVEDAMKKRKHAVVSHYQYTRRDESTFPVTVTAAPVVHGGMITGAVIVFRDISKESTRNEIKSDFVFLASHQLRIPLTTLNWFLEMLSRGNVGKLSGKQKYYVNHAYVASERMMQLVDDLLHESYIEADHLRIEPVSTKIHTFVQEIIEEMIPFAHVKHCSIIYKPLEKQDTFIPIDTTLLRHVLHILLSNAIEYSSPVEDERQYSQDKATGKEKTKKVPKATIVVEMKQRKHEYIVSVHDSGIGIPKISQPRIFTKLFRGHNAIKKEETGAGLGLYVAKMIMNAAGGRIWFDSGESGGTTFFIAIPEKGMQKQEKKKGRMNKQ